LTLSDWHSERLSMTATVHALHAIQTEAELPPMIQNGNPDRIEVSHDFENDAARQIWIEAIAQHAQIESGDLSAQLSRRALAQPANHFTFSPEGDGLYLLRSVGHL